VILLLGLRNRNGVAVHYDTEIVLIAASIVKNQFYEALNWDLPIVFLAKVAIIVLKTFSQQF